MQACGLLLFLLVAPAGAQTAAEAGARAPIEHRRAEERQLQQREALQRGAEVWGTPDGPLPALRWPEQEAPCVAVRHIALTGAESDRFQFVLQDLVAGADPAIGRCLGAEGVSIAAARAQRRLTARGFTTSRILLEPQDLSQGSLRLSLLPGRISAIRFADGTSPRATQLNAVPARVGDILNLRDIEQALENLRRVPTVEADIQIVPGKGPAESELILRWRQARPLRLSLSLDDSGTRATGRYQASATLSADHWWTLNDLFYLTQGRDLGGGEPGARGTRNASLHYSLPLWDAKKGQWVDKKNMSTFFPPSWSQARIDYEVSEAFKKGTPGTSFVKPSPSGIDIQFHWNSKNQRTTFYPLKEVMP
jgi:hemolysin activation/secretion protein